MSPLGPGLQMEKSMLLGLDGCRGGWRESEGVPPPQSREGPMPVPSSKEFPPGGWRGGAPGKVPAWPGPSGVTALSPRTGWVTLG